MTTIMKELTIEQKAQRYDEVLNKAKNTIEVNQTIPDIVECVESLFPELKESEDGGIKEELILYLKGITFTTIERAEQVRNWIAWLEKQGENISLPKFTFDDILALQCCMETVKKVQEDKDLYEKLNDLHGRVYDAYHLENQGEQKSIYNVPSREVILAIWDLGNEWKELTGGSISTEYGTQLDYIQKHWEESEYYLREKQGEKPTDKVEPKFYKGDWVVNTVGDTNQVVKVLGDGYTLDDNTFLSNSWATEHYHLWTIQDAKDGDVLTCYSDIKRQPIEQTGIIKQYVGRHGGCSNCFEAYIGVDWDGNIITDGYMGSSNIYPATKSQRDTLGKAMADAGYIFDFEKKELKKIEQKPAWKPSDEQIDALNDAIDICSKQNNEIDD